MTNNFVITEFDGKWIIETNKTDKRNGVENWELAGPILTIPSVIDGHQIEEIGVCAFYKCYNLEDVIISNNIKAIHNQSFSDCFNLRSIIIPPSIEFIGYCGIHSYNDSLINDPLSIPRYNSKGFLTVIFQPNSHIQYIGRHAISRKENIIIYFSDKRYFPCDSDPFFQPALSNVKIYSMFTSSFCGYQTINSMTCKKFSFYNKSLFFFVFLTK